jgi:hypothetical protein
MYAVKMNRFEAIYVRDDTFAAVNVHLTELFA